MFSTAPKSEGAYDDHTDMEAADIMPFPPDMPPLAHRSGTKRRKASAAPVLPADERGTAGGRNTPLHSSGTTHAFDGGEHPFEYRGITGNEEGNEDEGELEAVDEDGCVVVHDNSGPQAKVPRRMRKQVFRVYMCRVQGCGRTFNWTSSLIAHEATHTSYTERRYQCELPLCGKRFHDSHSLGRHLKTHTSDRPTFRCSDTECTKLFVSERSLKTHMKTHTKEGMMNCTYPGCDRTFIVKCQLDLHMLRHTGDKQFACDQCGRRFFDKHRLRYHLKEHVIAASSGPLFSCTEPGCTRAFKSLVSLKTHRHNTVLQYRCTFRDCGRAFAKDKGLRSHYRRSHEGKEGAIGYTGRAEGDDDDGHDSHTDDDDDDNNNIDNDNDALHGAEEYPLLVAPADNDGGPGGVSKTAGCSEAAAVGDGTGGALHGGVTVAVNAADRNGVDSGVATGVVGMTVVVATDHDKMAGDGDGDDGTQYALSAGVMTFTSFAKV